MQVVLVACVACACACMYCACCLLLVVSPRHFDFGGVGGGEPRKLTAKENNDSPVGMVLKYHHKFKYILREYDILTPV